jgi:NTE family protein
MSYLTKIDRISSVSGGSITAAMLGLKWANLAFDNSGIGQKFQTEVVEPIRKLANRTIDRGSIIGGVLGPGSISDRIIKAYRKYLYDEATLQDLPDDKPTFVINATNVQSGALWRFSKKYLADYRVGTIDHPNLSLAVAVAASSAFPPFLSPVVLELDETDYRPPDPTREFPDLHYDPFTTEVVLSDGGVYDNLGLETAWKNYETVLISDAGGKMQPEADPKFDWAQHTYRILSIIDNQVRALRKRQVIESFKLRRKLLAEGVDPDSDTFKLVTRQGAYWGIRTDIADYRLADLPLDCPFEKTIRLAQVPTRLKALDATTQERLINWGYAICDAGMRQHVDQSLPVPTHFPYPQVGVG